MSGTGHNRPTRASGSGGASSWLSGGLLVWHERIGIGIGSGLGIVLELCSCGIAAAYDGLVSMVADVAPRESAAALIEVRAVHVEPFSTSNMPDLHRPTAERTDRRADARMSGRSENKT